MNVIGDTVDDQCLPAGIPYDSTHVAKETVANVIG